MIKTYHNDEELLKMSFYLFKVTKISEKTCNYKTGRLRALQSHLDIHNTQNFIIQFTNNGFL